MIFHNLEQYYNSIIKVTKQVSNNYVFAKKISVYKAAVVHLKLLMRFFVRAACFVAHGQEGQFTHSLIFNYQHTHW